MEQYGSTNQSSEFRVYSGPWANLWIWKALVNKETLKFRGLVIDEFGRYRKRTMKLTNLARKLQQHRSQFHRIHLCWVRDPVQPELIQALGTQNSLNEFVSFAMKYVRAIPILIVREFKSAGDRLMYAANAIGERNDLNIAKQRLIILISGESKDKYTAEIRYHRSCCSRFTYRKREDKDAIKLKNLWGGIEWFYDKNLNWASYTEAMYTFWMSCYKIGCSFVKIDNFYPRLDIHGR